jgi:hypothetical protein
MGINAARELVAAQNRTTHAVRAIAVFLIYSSIFNLAGGIIAGVSFAVSLNTWEGVNSSFGGLTFGLVLAGIGYIVAVIIAAYELSESKLRGVEQTARQDALPISAETPFAQDGEVVCRHCGQVTSGKFVRCNRCDGWLEAE